MKKIIKGGIYALINIKNGFMYIGSTKNHQKREVVHFRQLRKDIHHNTWLQRVYKKYGNIFYYLTLVEGVFSQEQLFCLEQDFFDIYSPEYNIGAIGGGDNYSNHPKKEELRKRLAKQLRAAPKPAPKYGKDNPNWKGGISKKYCKCGNRMALTAATCMSCRDRTGKNNPFYGKKHSQESIEKTKKINAERRSRKSYINPNSKKVECVFPDGTIKIFKSATKTAEYFKMWVGSITRLCNSGRVTNSGKLKGHKFVYI